MGQHAEAIRSAGGNDDVLLAVAALICDRHGVSSRIEAGHPELFASSGIEGAELGVGCCSDEYQAPSGHDRAAHVCGSGILDALCFHFVVAAERPSPGEVALRVDCYQLTSLRLLAWKPVLIDEALIPAFVAPRHRRAIGRL